MSTPVIPSIPAKGTTEWYAYIQALDAVARTVQPALVGSVAVIPYAANVTPDASAANTQRITLSGNITIAPPANPSENQKLVFELTAVGTGPWAVTLTSGAGGFKFGTDLTTIPAVPTGTTMRIGVVYRTSTARWDVVSVLSGF